MIRLIAGAMARGLRLGVSFPSNVPSVQAQPVQKPPDGLPSLAEIARQHTDPTESERVEQARDLLGEHRDLRTITGTGSVLSPKQKQLVEHLKEKTGLEPPRNVPTKAELTELRGAVQHLRNHLNDEVEATAAKFLHTGSGTRGFESLTKQRLELQDRIDKLDYLYGGDPGPARMERQHLQAQLGRVDGAIHAKLARAGKVGRYTSSEARQRSAMALCRQDRESAVRFAASPNTPLAVLADIARAYPDDKEIKQLLSVQEQAHRVDLSRPLQGQEQQVDRTSDRALSFKSVGQLATTRADLHQRIAMLDKLYGGNTGSRAQERSELAAQLALVDARLFEKLADPGAIKKATNNEDKLRGMMALCEQDRQVATLLASSAETPPALLAHIAGHHGDDPGLGLLLLDSDRARPEDGKRLPSQALHALLEQSAALLERSQAEQDPDAAARARQTAMELQRKVAQHPNANSIDLKRLCEGALRGLSAADASTSEHAQSLLDAIAAHPNTNASTLAKLAGERSQDLSRDFAEKLAGNPNTPASALLTLAGCFDRDVLKRVAEHPNAGKVVLQALITREPNLAEVRAAALARLPDLGHLDAEAVRHLARHDPQALLEAIHLHAGRTLATADGALGVGDTVTGRSAALVARAKLEVSVQIDALRQIVAAVPDDAHPHQAVRLQEAAKRAIADLELRRLPLADEQNKLERPAQVAGALTQMRGQRDAIWSETERLKSHFQPSLRTVHWNPEATVHTLDRLAEVATSMDTALLQTGGTLEVLRRQYARKDGPDGLDSSLEVIKAKLDLLPGALDVGQAASDLHALVSACRAGLDEELQQGTLPRAERTILEDLLRNVDYTVDAYREGREALGTRRTQLEAELDAAEQGGRPSPVVRGAKTVEETAARLDQELRKRLDLPASVSPEYVAQIKIDATALIKDRTARALTRLMHEYAGTDPRTGHVAPDLSPERQLLVAYLQLQVKKLERAGEPAVLKDFRSMEAELEKQLEGQLKAGAAGLTRGDLDAIGQLKAATDGAVKHYDSLAAAVDKRLEDLVSNESKVGQKVALVKQLLGTSGSGGYDTTTLSLHVKVPVPGLEVNGRYAYTFGFQRNPETGQVWVTYQHEAGLGASYGLGGSARVGLEALGGKQTKYVFDTAEQAGEFLHYLETRTPPDYVPPNPHKVGFLGAKALIEAELPGKTVSISGEASARLELERGAHGEDIRIQRYQAMGSLQVDLARVGTDATSLVSMGSGSDALNPGSLTATLNLDARVSYQVREVSEHGMRTPEQDKRLTTVEVSLGAGLDFARINAIAAALGVGTVMAHGGYEKVRGDYDKSSPLTGAALWTLYGASGGQLQAGGVLQVEYENGAVIGVRIGTQARMKAELEVTVLLARGGVSWDSQLRTMSTVYMPKDRAGLARMETYFMCDELLSDRTMASAGWQETDVIEGKSVRAWRTEWTRNKEEARELSAIKADFLAGQPIEDRERVIGGKKLGQYEQIWTRERGDQSLLDELKALYLADHTRFKSTYRSAKADRGLPNDLTSHLFGTARTLVADRYLHEHEAEWALEQQRQGELRGLEQQVA